LGEAVTIDQTQLAGILVALAALVAAATKGVGNIIVAFRTVEKKVDDVGAQAQSAASAATKAADKVDVVGAQVETATAAATATAAGVVGLGVQATEIQHLVNGNAGKAAEQIRDLTARLDTMHAQLMDVMEKRVDDAKAAPPTNPQKPLPVVVVDQRKP
jgi:uncharacterized phage infection (PIP) family protein YhgE